MGLIKVFPEIPYSTIILRPGAGPEKWHDRLEINYPNDGTRTEPPDRYQRFVWTRLEGKTRGSYNFTFLENLIKECIALRQMLSIGIMTVYPEGTTNEGLQAYDGGTAAYPEWLNILMQGEQVKSWRKGSTWVPNYNSQHYCPALLALHTATNTFLETNSYMGVKYKDVIRNIDIRGYGSWGEWHSANLVDNVSEYPAGTFPTIATFKKIVDAHTIGFPNHQLVAMIAAFDAMWLNNTKNPAEIAYYVLTQSNNYGPIGWRRDQWGATDQYLKDYLENNNRSFNGMVFKGPIMDRWKTAPITGEPPAWNPGDYYDLERQIRLYHATSFGNGNYGVTPNTTIKNRVRAAGNAAGYRLKLVSADVPVTSGTNVVVKTNWINVGISPVYDKFWKTFIEFKDANGVVKFTGESKFQPRLFLPQATETPITDEFTVPAGTYTLNVVIRDTRNYYPAMPLASQGKNSDGSYTIGSVAVTTTVPPVDPVPDVPPVVFAGPDQVIYSPTSQATLYGSATDVNGPVSVKWTRISGTGVIGNDTAASTVVTNLSEGNNVFRITGTQAGVSKYDDVNIVRNAAPSLVTVESLTINGQAIVNLSDGRTQNVTIS